MKFPFFTGKPENRNRKEPAELPTPKRTGLDDPKGYLAEDDTGLIDAVNVAIVLGQPLLLTGEPGVGKTTLAFAVASELGFGKPEKFETKSTSTARDLFYVYDSLGRFYAARTDKEGRKLDPLNYIKYNALGIAILQANEERNVKQWLPEDFIHDSPRRSVVLIDEVDKAPRDFPNDILNEIEGMYFKIPELGNAKISADQSMRPVVIITSNSEKHLPDAFLRRCIYYNIPTPDRDQLNKIIKSRVGKYVDNNTEFLTDLLSFFSTLREDGSGLLKKPATDELLVWIIALKEISRDKENPMRNNDVNLRHSLTALVKNSDDLKQAEAILDRWIEGFVKK